MVGPWRGAWGPLGEWLTNFQRAVVALDPNTNESSWVLDTAARILRTLAEADVRVAWLVAADADLDAAVEDPVTRVEWGEGKAEVLAGERLEVRIERARADDADAEGADPRVITVTAHGEGLAARFA